MKIRSGLLEQLEKCGLSAELAEEHAEIGEDTSGTRAIRHEIARAYHAQDQAQIPEADASLRWMMGEPGKLVSLSEPLDLVNPDTGEVLVSGKPGAIFEKDDGHVLVVAWQAGAQHEAPEPDDDLGLLAMGLAAAGPARPFRVAYLVAQGLEAFCRRSVLFPTSGHAALLARIKTAVSRPRIACTGDWCGACRQAPYCEAWLARAKTSLAVLCQDVQLETLDMVDGNVVTIPQLDLTNDSASALAVRLQIIEKVADMAKEQLKAFVRRGGVCVRNGKQMHFVECKGRETVDVDAVKADGLFAKYGKVGKPYETTAWKKVESASRKK